MPRYRRTPLPLAASGLIVDAIVIDGRTLSLAVPDSNRTCSPWFVYDVADRIADEHCDAARRPQGGLDWNTGGYSGCRAESASRVHCPM